MGKQRIDEALKTCIQKGEKVFIPYIMAGDGGLDKLKQHLKFFEKAGAAAVELGIPFSDPVADGPVIQKAGKRALDAGVTLKSIIDKLIEIREEVKIPIILMTYLNPVFAYGVDRFAQDCLKAGVDGCIIPDMPFEEEAIVSGPFKQSEIALVRLVTLTSPEARLRKIASEAEGFLYAVTIKGTTGARDHFGEETGRFLQKVKSLSEVPVLAGFGISTPEHVKEAGRYCDGAVVGSKVVQCLHTEDYEEITRLIEAAKGKVMA
ncbi:tryptophan synthase subunit alpha [Peribacillus cavernae]|uniref:Tryptophan synthase alpha chain n=1 Tax=Peribacillus cavernae TaxID=1674310 RepID=A0A433HPT6_9BACI|nr:tryptophan synthase subunit alpha [Peribacillus cavernae]MDQ0217225.1 tryptophan synthase alpha chain [Peribacillus cavernae]RUQ30304.1 tryptophan synthase subunit alpha [Peribacillus cavernae]